MAADKLFISLLFEKKRVLNLFRKVIFVRD